MMTEEIFEDAVLDAGWDEEQQVDVLLKYVDSQEDDEALADYLFEADPDAGFEKDPEAHVVLLLGYIENQRSDEAFRDFLEQEVADTDAYRRPTDGG